LNFSGAEPAVGSAGLQTSPTDASAAGRDFHGVRIFLYLFGGGIRPYAAAQEKTERKQG